MTDLRAEGRGPHDMEMEDDSTNNAKRRNHRTTALQRRSRRNRNPDSCGVLHKMIDAPPSFRPM